MDEDDPVVTELDGDFEAQPWQWDARRSDGWIFVSLPEELSDDLRLAAGEPRGFGSVRVGVRLGGSAWETSVFPDKERGVFVLPLKKAVRVAEGVEVGEPVRVAVRLLRG